ATHPARFHGKNPGHIGTAAATEGCACAGLCPPKPLSRPGGSGRASARSEFSFFAHDPEKWVPVFGKDHAPLTSWRWLIFVIEPIESGLNLFLSGCARFRETKSFGPPHERASDLRRNPARVRPRPRPAAGARQTRARAHAPAA